VLVTHEIDLEPIAGQHRAAVAVGRSHEVNRQGGGLDTQDEAGLVVLEVVDGDQFVAFGEDEVRALAFVEDRGAAGVFEESALVVPHEQQGGIVEALKGHASTFPRQEEDVTVVGVGAVVEGVGVPVSEQVDRHGASLRLWRRYYSDCGSRVNYFHWQC
jgi:hypothetical protein